MYRCTTESRQQCQKESEKEGKLELTVVVEVIQRADATAPTTTTERKRNAALVLDSVVESTARRRQSAAGAAVAMAGRRLGVYLVWPRKAKRKP
ncbi:hypothetical protein PR202_ga19557 [Eleusine coracana subsp. coracana]|uniref:Uncharacterized protein n=1 Tax=Eleusine coracana subsp. coracana TaxID=191504 RepID=A0AAV5CWA9_ELECO|nr:hypothetical protein PR202_ga19557 [Eleusine coracana subsp. coracana]